MNKKPYKLSVCPCCGAIYNLRLSEQVICKGTICCPEKPGNLIGLREHLLSMLSDGGAYVARREKPDYARIEDASIVREALTKLKVQ